MHIYVCVCVLCLFMIINIVYGCSSHCCRLYCNNHTVLKIWLFSMNNLLHWAHLTANDCMYYGALLKSKYNKSKTFSYQSISTQNQCCFEAGWMMPWLFLYKAGRFFFFGVKATIVWMSLFCLPSSHNNESRISPYCLNFLLL